MKTKILTLFLCLVLLMLPFGSAFAQAPGAEPEGGVSVLTEPSAVMKIVIIEKSVNIPVRIAPVRLTLNGETSDAYLICMLGVKDNDKQVNSGKNLFSAAFNRDNSYSEFVKSLVFEKIPEGSKLLFAGHSLGGMVAQHLRQDADLIEKYDIVNVMSAGSPLILTNKPTEGSLNRLADKWDAVPFMSPATLLCPLKQIGTAHREDGGYFFKPDGAHNLSYLRPEIWGGYDALGNPGCDAVIEIDESAIENYGVV